MSGALLPDPPIIYECLAEAQKLTLLQERTHPKLTADEQQK